MKIKKNQISISLVLAVAAGLFASLPDMMFGKWYAADALLDSSKVVKVMDRKSPEQTRVEVEAFDYLLLRKVRDFLFFSFGSKKFFPDAEERIFLKEARAMNVTSGLLQLTVFSKSESDIFPFYKKMESTLKNSVANEYLAKQARILDDENKPYKILKQEYDFKVLNIKDPVLVSRLADAFKGFIFSFFLIFLLTQGYFITRDSFQRRP